MSENIRLPWGVSRVYADTLDLLEDEERRCLELSVLQCSILRQMTFPWVRAASRLVEDHGDYQTIVDQPVAYQEALDELEVLLSGAYDGPETGCPVGEVFVDRGNPSAVDFSIGSGLTADSGWHTLSIGNIVSAGASRVLLQCSCKDNLTNAVFRTRPFGNSYAINAYAIRTQLANVYNYQQVHCWLFGGDVFEYLITSGMDAADITVCGWWVPAV